MKWLEDVASFVGVCIIFGFVFFLCWLMAG